MKGIKKNRNITLVNFWLPCSNMILTLLLGISSIYMAVTISKSQEKIIKLQYQPIFSVIKNLVKNEITNKYDDEIITIKNIGHPVQEYNKKIYSLISFSNTESRKKIVLRVIYYLHTTKKENEKGSIIINSGMDNNSHYLKALEAFNEENKNKIFSMDLYSLLNISYIDVSGDENHIYYKDDTLITSAIYNELLSEGTNVDTIKISDLSKEKILEIMEKIKNHI